MKDIGGKVAIVTGASRGLGRHIAETLFDHGVKLVVTARGADELEGVRAQFDRTGTRSVAIAGDVTDDAHRTRVVVEAQRRFGSLDILVNNAGRDHPERFVEVSPESIRGMFDLSVISMMAMTQRALVPMLAHGSGHIVNLASTAGLAPVPYASVDSATMHAIVGFSQSLRYEIADQGVGVSVVCPALVWDAGLFDGNRGGETSKTPTASPQEVADAVVKAITGNRGRVIVSSPMIKLAPVVKGLSPAITARVAKMTGSHDRMRGIAERMQAEEVATKPGSSATAVPVRRRPEAPRRGPDRDRG